MALVWVIGSGGLLGQALVSELADTEETLFDSGIQFSWNNPQLAQKQLEETANNFALITDRGPWKIYWAAGTGTMHSNEEDLQAETNLLESFISNLLNSNDLDLQSGTFIFASSAGAIYAGVQDEVMNESTSPAPINAYGKAKLLQEEIINQLNRNGQGATVVSCRISTLYGFKAKDGKQQGLIAEMIRRMIANEVVHIYVPLETMRDYISAKDAAKQMIDAAEYFKDKSGVNLRIIASGISTSVAQILTIIKHISKRKLRIVTKQDIKGSQYQRIVQFKSELNKTNNQSNQTNLIEGISKLVKAIEIDIAKNG